MWGRGKEEDELNFKGKSAGTASCREMANTYRNSKEKKDVARKSKDRVSSDCTQGSFTSNQLAATYLSAIKRIHPSKALKNPSAIIITKK